jgi:hypothetical protein
MTWEARAILRPDLRLQDGDVVTLSLYGGTKTVTIFAQVTEEFERTGPLPRWRILLEANPIFENTEAGGIPSSVLRSGHFMQLHTGYFNHVLSDKDTNVQKAMNTLDNHNHTSSDVIGWNLLQSTIAASTTVYLTPFQPNAGAANIGTKMPVDGVLRNLYVTTQTAQPGSGTLVFTVQKNGVNQSLAVTVPAGGAAGTRSDTSHSISMAAGDGLSLKVDNNASGASAQIRAITLEGAIETQT